MSEDFIDEIKEDVRKDQLLAIWKNYGNLIIGVLLTIILFTTGYLFWHSYKEGQLHDQTLRFEKALTAQDSQQFGDLSQDGSKGYAILSLFEQARLDTQNPTTALKVLAEKSGVDSFYTDLAALQVVMKKFDSTRGEELLDDLSDLVKGKSKVQAAALELQGFVYLKLKRLGAARESFTAVMNHRQAPRGLRVRARAILEMLG